MVFVPRTTQLPAGFSFLSDHSPVTLINKDDFGLDRFFSIIGFNAMESRMFSSDSAEIGLRQDVVKDLLRSTTLRNSLMRANEYNLPLGHDEFVRQYQLSDRTPFWQDMHLLLDVLRQSNVRSDRLQTLRDFVTDNMQLEVLDRHVAGRIAGQVNNMVISAGHIELRFQLYQGDILREGYNSAKINSYRRYGPQTLAVLDENLRRHRQVWWWNLLPEWMQRKKDYEFVQSVLQAQQSDDASSFIGKKVSDLAMEIIRGVYKAADETSQARLDGYYRVVCAVINDGYGSRFRIIDVQPQGLDSVPQDRELDSIKDDIGQLWPDSIRPKIDKAIKNGNYWLSNQLGRIKTTELTQALVAADGQSLEWQLFQPEWTSRNGRTPVSKTVSMKDLWESPELVEASTAVSNFMKTMSRHLQELSMISKNLSGAMAFAKKLDIKLKMPTLVEDGHIIAFDQMIPVQVYEERPKDQEPMVLVPVTGMQPLGGSMVVLTGDHGGGKTSICEMLAQQIYLAQSGFPIFGEGMKWSARETIGLSLLEREHGSSTMQVFMRKMERLLASINESPRSRLLLIMDEVGTGTSPDRGEQIGRMIIDNFTNAGIDLLFATQITQVARYAVEHGAISYQVNRQHKLTEGIGEPDLAGLMEEFGVTEGFAALSRAA